jgi:hypothetical protein
MNLQVEGAVRKIYSLSENSVLLFSGTVVDGEEILSRTWHRISAAGTAPTDIAAIATNAALSYQDLKRRRVEDTILPPHLGIDFVGSPGGPISCCIGDIGRLGIGDGKAGAEPRHRCAKREEGFMRSTIICTAMLTSM